MALWSPTAFCNVATGTPNSVTDNPVSRRSRSATLPEAAATESTASTRASVSLGTFSAR